MRRLYLVRHGEAKPDVVDPQRSLTDDGRAAVEKVGLWAAGAGVTPPRIRHSGKRRAEQTAEILARHLNPADGISLQSGIGPNDDVNPIADLIAAETADLMLVGHLPFMSRLAGLLLIGDSERPFVNLKTGSMLCLERLDRQWVLSWLYTPDPS